MSSICPCGVIPLTILLSTSARNSFLKSAGSYLNSSSVISMLSPCEVPSGGVPHLIYDGLVQ